MTHITSAPDRAFKHIVKNSYKCDSFMKLWFSKESTVSDSDFLNAIKDLTKNIKEIEDDYLEENEKYLKDKYNKKREQFTKDIIQKLTNEYETKHITIIKDDTAPSAPAGEQSKMPTITQKQFDEEVNKLVNEKIKSEIGYEKGQQIAELGHLSSQIIDTAQTKYLEEMNQKNEGVKWEYNKANSMRDKLLTIYKELFACRGDAEVAAMKFLYEIAGGLNIDFNREVKEDVSVQNNKNFFDREKTDEEKEITVSKLTADFASLFGEHNLKVKSDLPLTGNEVKIQERQQFLNNVLVDFCHEPEMQEYAENLCMVDSRFVGLQQINHEEKNAILEAMKQKGKALFAQENASKNYNLVSPQSNDERLASMSKYEKMIYTSLYNDLMDGKFSREDMEYASSLLNKA